VVGEEYDMNFLPSSHLIRKAFEEGYAIPSFCVWNSETMDTVLRVASKLQAPVMLMHGPGEFGLLPPAKMAATARAIAKTYDVPAALHLDHGDSMNWVDACLDAGYTSVMLDYSDKPFAENVKALRNVVQRTRRRNITVEGELGAVGRVDDRTAEGTKASTLTDPEQAAVYVKETGVDILAVSIGNAHGLYTRRPQFDFELLNKLRTATNIPLVLHGGSGTPEEDLRKAIAFGIAKINIASDLVYAIRKTLEDAWKTGESRWLPHTLSEAMDAMAFVVEKWIHLCGASGRA
jgi:tagatose 1,6-diphosphate aldolase GatY/KbaY